MREIFRHFAHRASRIVGSPFTFIAAVLIIVVWALTGSIFHYSDTWQLIINTGTTIITFLMVFLIQNTQNRDAEAMHLKLDELLRASGEARNSMVDVENMSDAELARLHQEFHQLQYQEIIPELQKRGKPVLEPGDVTS
ncbi:MAG: low affinity iron permease family protein [Longimicrobiales bacterium]